MAFATLDDYLAYHPTTDTGDYTRIARALDAACADIRAHCSQHFDFVEDDAIVVHGTGRVTLLLPELPIVAVNEVIINVGLDSELEVTDYRFDPLSGVLYRTADDSCWPARWPLGFANITVDYDHGYDAASIPQNLIRTAVQLSYETLIAESGRLRSETIAGYSYTRDAGNVTVNDYRDVLELYRAKRIPVA